MVGVPLSRAITAFLFLMFLVECVSGKSSVTIRNSGIPNSLWIRCKSKDDDLGWRKLEDGEEFEWSFKEGFWMNTLFHCLFVWNGGHNWLDHTVWHSVAKDMPVQCGQCLWKAQLDGTYVWGKKEQRFVPGYPWLHNGHFKWPPAAAASASTTKVDDEPSYVP